MPAAFASASAGFRASGSFGLNTMALTPFAMRSRRSDSWPAASVLRWMVVSSETWPDALACALAVQTCSSRKPLPTPPPLEYPILYCLAAAEADSAGAEAAADSAALGAAALGAFDAPPLVQAAATTAMVARPTSSRTGLDP